MKKVIFSILISFPFIVGAQIDRSKQPQPGKAPVINIKDSEVFKMENGITVILSENHKLPRVSFDFVMGSDPKLEKAGSYFHRTIEVALREGPVFALNVMPLDIEEDPALNLDLAYYTTFNTEASSNN